MILLSAGHYPKAPGACNGNWCEHDEAMHWMQHIFDLIYDRHSIKVDKVPTGSLTSKIEYVNAHAESILACEIHFNANVKAKGSETLYCPGSEKGKTVAAIIQKALASVFQPDRGIKEGWYRMDRPGVVDYPGDVEGDEAHDAFLSKTHCVALIVEPEFISNRLTIENGMMSGTLVLANALIEAHNKLTQEAP